MTIFVLSLAASAPALAQSPAPAAPQKSLASTLEAYAFPNGGQDAAQQSKDEAECCGWAVQNTGNDCFDSASRAQQQIHQQSQLSNVHVRTLSRSALEAVVNTDADVRSLQGSAGGRAAGA